ncbi:MAG TPA: penicillin-binding transpeptidase domain-containing protein, partial [Gemmatimonadales bacterium]|nr:penicillin-binding transpeptidase domain-containing protein [Gemmatimonadales bacterium]
DQQMAVQSLPAPRGAIVDATGEPLVQSRESLRLAIAPLEVRDHAEVERGLKTAGVPSRFISRSLDTTRRWVELPGNYALDEVGTLLGRDGVHATPVSERLYPEEASLRLIVGTARNGDGQAGIELALDSLLKGTPGSAPMLRDGNRRRFESPRFTTTAPRTGNTVVLTVHNAVQEIVERALESAIRETGATGGDVVVVNPHTGDVLAMASRRNTRRATMGALTEPYEPGSTLKPIIAARLLDLGRARIDEVIDTPKGMITPPGFRRPVRDVHVEDRQSLADVLRYSSNVGIIRFAERLTPGEQYEALRDAGFGMTTGVPFPSEASGVLRHPSEWWASSPASMAMGYGLSVTPLQLAMAYAAIANGGELLEPRMVREIRTPGGEVMWKSERRPVRRIMSEETARVMRGVLGGVVDSGTAKAAQLTSYEVGGKSGTTRNAAGGSYAAGMYLASFVSIFPAADPQFVVLVKIDNPSGKYYGGATAAPVSKVVLEASLAARDAALDRRTLARAPWSAPDTDGGDAAVQHQAEAGPDARAAGASASVLASGTNGGTRASAGSASGTNGGIGLSGSADREAAAGIGDGADDNEAEVAHSTVARNGEKRIVRLAALDSLRDASELVNNSPRMVPDVKGESLRDAALALHRAGFRVRVTSDARGETQPTAGSMAAPGTVIRLGRGR